jgi:hypothetical protein
MKKRTRATWISRKEVPIWCCDFGGFGSDRQGLVAEIAVSQAVIDQQAENSLLVAVDLNDARPTSEIVEFFNSNASRARTPIRKLAILGVSDFQRFWYRRVKRISWPKKSRFFDDWEKAKDWLITDRF